MNLSIVSLIAFELLYENSGGSGRILGGGASGVVINMIKHPILSEQEVKVVEFAATGLIDKEIACELEISVGTVITDWNRIRKKLHCSSRGAAIAELMRFRSQHDVADSTIPHVYDSCKKAAFAVLELIHNPALVVNEEDEVVFMNRKLLDKFRWSLDAVRGTRLYVSELTSLSPPAIEETKALAKESEHYSMSIPAGKQYGLLHLNSVSCIAVQQADKSYWYTWIFMEPEPFAPSVPSHAGFELQSSSDAHIFVDALGRVIGANAGGLKVLGVDDLNDALGRCLADFVDSRSEALITGVGVPEALSKGYWTSEIQFRSHPTGPVSAVLFAHHSAQGTLAYYSLNCGAPSLR